MWTESLNYETEADRVGLEAQATCWSAAKFLRLDSDNVRDTVSP